MKKNREKITIFLIFFLVIFTFATCNVYAKVDVNLNPKYGCAIISNDLKEWLQWALDVVRVGGIVLTVILGIMDYMNAIFASDESNIKKANGNFSKRLAGVLMLFLTPTIISFLIDLVNLSFGNNDPSCGIK